MVTSGPVLLQWTVSGPAGPSGVPAQPYVVQGNRAPPEQSCNPASTGGPHVRDLTIAPRPAPHLTAVSEDGKNESSSEDNYSKQHIHSAPTVVDDGIMGLTRR